MEINIKATPVFEEIFNTYDSNNIESKQGFVLEGGSRSSKTWSIIQFIIIYCSQNNGKSITISRLKRTWLTATVLIDFIEILQLLEIWQPDNFNKTELIYELFGLFARYHFDQIDFVLGTLFFSFLISSLLQILGVIDYNWFLKSFTIWHILFLLFATPFFHFFANLLHKKIRVKQS